MRVTQKALGLQERVLVRDNKRMNSHEQNQWRE